MKLMFLYIVLPLILIAFLMAVLEPIIVAKISGF